MTRSALIKRIAIVAGVLLAATNYVAHIRLGFAGPIPDLNPLGASAQQILAFRDALGFEGKEIFNGTYRVLDFGLICALTGLIALLARDQRPKRFWWTILGFGIIFAIADLSENYLMAQIVNTVPENQNAAWPEWVNIATRIKFAGLLMAAAAWITVWRQEGETS